MARKRLCFMLILLLALSLASVADAQDTQVGTTIYTAVELRSNGEKVAEILTLGVNAGGSMRPACALVADSALLESDQNAAINAGSYNAATRTLAIDGSASIQLTSNTETAASINLGSTNNALVMPIGFSGDIAFTNGLSADIFTGRLQLDADTPAVCGLHLPEGQYNLVSDDPFQLYGAVMSNTMSETSLSFDAVYGAFDASYVSEADLYRFRLGQLPRPEGIDTFLLPIEGMTATASVVSDFDVSESDGTAGGDDADMTDGTTDGSANGTSNGTSDGSGDGTGDGTGNGTANGSGDGSSDGTGNGTGDGTGNGTGDGTSNGSSNGSLIDVDVDAGVGGDGSSDGSSDGSGSLIDVDADANVGGEGSSDGGNGGNGSLIDVDADTNIGSEGASDGGDNSNARLLDVDLDAGIAEGESDFENGDDGEEMQTASLLGTNVMLDVLNENEGDGSLVDLDANTNVGATGSNGAGNGTGDGSLVDVDANANVGGNGSNGAGNNAGDGSLIDAAVDANVGGNNGSGGNNGVNVDADANVGGNNGVDVDAGVNLGGDNDEEGDGVNVNANVGGDNGVNVGVNAGGNNNDNEEEDGDLLDVDLDSNDGDGVNLGLNLGD